MYNEVQRRRLSFDLLRTCVIALQGYKKSTALEKIEDLEFNLRPVAVTWCPVAYLWHVRQLGLANLKKIILEEKCFVNYNSVVLQFYFWFKKIKYMIWGYGKEAEGLQRIMSVKT